MPHPPSTIDKTALGPGPNQAPDVAIGLAEARYDAFLMISVHTDLRMGASGAKFDAEADFEVRLPLASPKPS